MNKTRKQVQDELAKEKGFKDWDDLSDPMLYDDRQRYLSLSREAYDKWKKEQEV